MGDSLVYNIVQEHFFSFSDTCISVAMAPSMSHKHCAQQTRETLTVPRVFVFVIFTIHLAIPLNKSLFIKPKVNQAMNPSFSDSFFVSASHRLNSMHPRKRYVKLDGGIITVRALQIQLLVNLGRQSVTSALKLPQSYRKFVKVGYFALEEHPRRPSRKMEEHRKAQPLRSLRQHQ